ncbi:hypothetical protein ABW19_dt0208551 [Dactylella cylindrospora]|nr:hypothetical protein ABW19_dt0208551 [Dactylella cylindrospora]
MNGKNKLLPKWLAAIIIVLAFPFIWVWEHARDLAKSIWKFLPHGPRDGPQKVYNFLKKVARFTRSPTSQSPELKDRQINAGKFLAILTSILVVFFAIIYLARPEWTETTTGRNVIVGVLVAMILGVVLSSWVLDLMEFAWVGFAVALSSVGLRFIVQIMPNRAADDMNHPTINGSCGCTTIITTIIQTQFIVQSAHFAVGGNVWMNGAETTQSELSFTFRAD